MPPDHIIPSQRVQNALEKGLPVVALESTVLTHGLPYPQNLNMLRSLETILEDEGVTPATIIVLDGKAHVGLDEADIDALIPSLKNPSNFQKLGMRDLALSMAQSTSGGTTVSATMKLANACGIQVFATGGIGGVHRGWSKILDISSDLTALAQIPVAVVSAGCKAILDIPATLEYLETLAIPVLGWQTNSFPLFYTAQSDYPIDTINTSEEFAGFWQKHLALGGKGVLIANPIPAEFSIPAQQMEVYIQTAIAAAKVQSIGGKALTPFLLDFLAQHTKGDSVEANMALLKNNVRLAASLAKAIAINKG